MSAVYRKSGETIAFTPSETVEAGTIKNIGNLVGVTLFQIESGEPGVLKVVGVFDGVPKVTGAISAGAVVYFNPTEEKIQGTSAAGCIPCGYATAAAASGDTEMSVFFTPSAQAAAAECAGPPVENQADSIASTVAATVTDLNALLAKLKSGGIMEADAEA